LSIKIKGDNGVRINVEDIGSKNGKPVVFIHGWPVNHNMFEYHSQNYQNMAIAALV